MKHLFLVPYRLLMACLFVVAAMLCVVLDTFCAFCESAREHGAQVLEDICDTSAWYRSRR